MKVNLIILFLFFSVFTYAQDDSKFFIGLNVGGKIGNRYYGQRYSGAYQDQLALLLESPFIYQEIYQLLGNKNYQFGEYSLDNRYRPGFITGINLGFNTSPNLQFSLDANFNSLKVITNYTIRVDDPFNTTSEEQIRLGSILGKESRFNGRFNLDYIADGEQFRFIFGGSLLFHAWRMDQHVAEMEGYQLQLFSVHEGNINNFTRKTSGMGWGLGINTGVQFRINDKFLGQLVYQPYFLRAEYFATKSQIENAIFYTKPPLKLEHDLVLRILFK